MNTYHALQPSLDRLAAVGMQPAPITFTRPRRGRVIRLSLEHARMVRLYFDAWCAVHQVPAGDAIACYLAAHVHQFDPPTLRAHWREIASGEPMTPLAWVYLNAVMRGIERTHKRRKKAGCNEHTVQ